MMIFLIIVVSGIVEIQFIILQCNDGSVELSWKWEVLKPLNRYADPMPVCIGDTQINYPFFMFVLISPHKLQNGSNLPKLAPTLFGKGALNVSPLA